MERGGDVDKRDLVKDLKLCNRATKGPWVNDDGGFVSVDDGAPIRFRADICQMWNKFEDHFENHKANAEFIAEAREGWPHAIKRALRAEEALKRLGIYGALYRAKHNDKWVYGTLTRFKVDDEWDYTIWSNDGCCYKVDPETVEDVG